MATTDPNSQQTIIDNMRLARRLAGKTQEEAAQELGVTMKTYSRWERGETLGFLEELEKVANVFGTTVAQLTGREDPKSQLDALAAEVAALRALMTDPAALRRAADALEER